MNSINCHHSEYNLDENWGFYVDIENMPATLNTDKNNENNEKNNTYENYIKNYDYSIKGYNTEIFCMDEDIENSETNTDINVNKVSGLIITAALSYLIFLIL
jgi:hypothetical protein